MPEFKQIAVIGAGTMGSGIAAQIANAGNKVLLMDCRVMMILLVY